MSFVGFLAACLVVAFLIWLIVRCSDSESRERRHEQDRRWPRYTGDGK